MRFRKGSIVDVFSLCVVLYSRRWWPSSASLICIF
ncbi:unnamed protein product [Brassica rapa subsp. trilocularis]